MRQPIRAWILAVTLAACSGESTDPAGGLSGVVSSPQRGALAGVSVSLDDGRQSTTTDAEGRFAFEVVAPGSHSIEVETPQPGCSDPPPATVVQPERVSFAYDFTVECTPFGAISGTVTGTFWGALGEVTVRTADGQQAVTNASGEFLLEAIEPGSAWLSVVGAPSDCQAGQVVRSVPSGETLTTQLNLTCNGPELRFLRQVRHYPTDSGAVQGIRAYLPNGLSRTVYGWAVPYEGPGWNWRVPARRFELAPDRSAILVSNDIKLYHVTENSAPRLIFSDGANHYGASYSPSGNEFIHAVKYNQGSYAIIADALGGGAVEFNFRARVFYAEAFAWHPDGIRILFQTDDYAGYEYPRDPELDPEHAHIWIMNRDGSGRTQLTAGTSRDVRPIWSLDGARIAFLSDRGGTGFEPYVMDPGGGEPQPLPGNTYWIWGSGEISPIGDRLAYAAETNFDPVTGYGRSSIHIANPDGSEPQLLDAGGAGADYSPHWVR